MDIPVKSSPSDRLQLRPPRKSFTEELSSSAGLRTAALRAIRWMPTSYVDMLIDMQQEGWSIVDTAKATGVSCPCLSNEEGPHSLCAAGGRHFLVNLPGSLIILLLCCHSADMPLIPQKMPSQAHGRMLCLHSAYSHKI